MRRGPGAGQRLRPRSSCAATRRAASGSARSTRRTPAPWPSSSAPPATSGCEGIKLGPQLPGLRAARRSRASASTPGRRQHGLPILFHQGTSPIRTAPLRYAHPLVMDEIAIAFPDLRIVMAHLGHPVAGRHDRGHPQAPPRLRRRLGRASTGRGRSTRRCASRPSGACCPSCCSGRTSRSPPPAETIDGLRARERHPSRATRPAAGAPRTPIEAIIERDALALPRAWSGRAA